MNRAARLLILILACALPAQAIVKYDSGRLELKGVQLLQDSADATAYYYLPTAPRIATNKDGTLAFVALKYIDARGNATGGLFHCLVEFSLPQEVVTELQSELEAKIPGARIVGPVPLRAAEKTSEDQPGSFEIVSAILSDRAAGGMTRSLITSGTAPFTPGSQAAVAAMLTAPGSTLLWSSLEGSTSDVSVAVNGYYEAMVTGFHGRITADISTVYRHFSEIGNNQKEFTRRQIRDVSDTLIRNGDLKVESFDAGAASGMKTEDAARLLDLVTQKLTELMFDHKTGFSADPEREAAVEQNQLLGRQDRSWLSRTFGGTEDTKYYTDDQWVMKKRTDVRQNVFNITVSKNGTVRVPFSSTGNLHGLYASLKDDRRYFRIVNIDDPDFRTRQVHVQLDGNYVDAFADTVNFVAVNVRKRYADPSHPDVHQPLTFKSDEVRKGSVLNSVIYPLLGETGPDIQTYEYQVVWSVRDRQPVRVPANGGWTTSSDPMISLVPPFEKVQVEIDADRALFADANVRSAAVEFRYPLGGQSVRARKAMLRASDSDSSTSKITLYRDRSGKTEWMVTWTRKDGTTVKTPWKVMDDTYFNLTPPEVPQ